MKLREPQVLHRTAPYNMLSLRDLYTQLPEQDEGKLKRYGSDVFQRRDAYSTNQSLRIRLPRIDAARRSMFRPAPTMWLVPATR